MNIPVLTFSGKVVVRPDTTWNRTGEDFYAPDFIDSLSFSTVVFARVTRLGKCVPKRFASRYYSTVGDGILLYPDSMDDGSPEGYASACCLDKTSILPDSSSQPGPSELIDAAVESITRICRIRSGDIIAVETAPRQPLCTKRDGDFRVRVDRIPEFDIIFGDFGI